MPTKDKPPVCGSSKQQLVPVGKRDVFAKSQPKEGKQEKAQKPTTERALVLRNGKYGARGTGELMLMSRMTGREKMDLLAENIFEESKKAILSPLRLEKCLKIAESQADAYIDDIANLRDPELFRYSIETELKARADPTRTDPRRNPSYIAKAVATKVHNAYMLASAWRLVSDSLNELAIDGLTDKNVKAKLKNDPDIRARYLVVYDMVNDLITMSQNRFSVLATTTPHYSKYFKLKTMEGTKPAVPEYVFDWSDLRGAADSFLDSIIIELCFPQGMYPKAILYRILHDAIEESPREAKRFPQVLWDAVGDLSVSVELQELLTAPLLGPEGEEWKKQSRQMPEDYEKWVDAQLYSEKASSLFASFKDIIFPLEKTRRQNVLDDMWKQINRNYIAVSGEEIDFLWQLQDAFDYAPQWSASRLPDISEDSEDDELFPQRPRGKSGKKPKKRLAITNGDSDSNDSMPGLQSVSNTSDDDNFDTTDGDSESEEEESEDDDSGYNTEEEDEIRDMLREAMDAAHEADWFDSGTSAPEGIDPFAQEDRKGNPFLKLLGSLRGRMFSSDPKLKTTTRTEPRSRGAFRATASGVPKVVPKAMPKPTPASVPSTASSVPKDVSAASTPLAKSHKATVEDVEDEDDMRSGPKKKKKKPKKKKKASSDDIPPGSPSPPVQSMDSIASPTRQDTMSSISSMKTSASPSSSTVHTTPSFMSSTASLPSAQSGHSYLKSMNIGSEKKVKTRPDHASLFSNSEPKKQGFFSKMTGIGGKDKESEMKEAKRTWFSRLSRKTSDLMHQLIKSSDNQPRAPMKWENFLKIMREMGFTYDPSTAGSSVRFDPPNKNDKPITFHKPHPDPTLQPEILHKFAKRLKRYYGWDEEDLLRA
ncbi:hypothetical protein CPB84DRAFT_1727744 [Gymnopilus junonius]|uniref:Uncharacterized protein n=1 Tax=Gymnopilus junonius TaxID=109634 RepID=A0A9P5NUH9_GYMJU|nr:hypothetical protein CPB84DRAFT_1727744 [Gymnopilus junonius]